MKKLSKNTKLNQKMVNKVIFFTIFIAIIASLFLVGLSLHRAWEKDKNKIHIQTQELEDVKNQNQELKQQLKQAQDAITFNSDKLLEYTNEQRVLNGVPPLGTSKTLGISAKTKAENMVAENYWAHNKPDGTEPWDFFVRAG